MKNTRNLFGSFLRRTYRSWWLALLLMAVGAVAAKASPFAYVAITPDGAFVYVANYFDNSVSVIAKASNTVVATVPMGIQPVKVAITPF